MIAFALALAAPVVADYGPAPTATDIRQTATAAVLAQLVDPGSAQLSWPYASVPSTRKGLLASRITGWSVCGRINSKNRMGGYSGQTWVLATLNAGRVIDLQIGDPLGTPTPASLTCDAWLKDNTLRPVTSGAAVVAQNEARGMASAQEGRVKGGYGFSYVPTPYGVSVMAVAPGSRAEAAGLRAGADIVAINGSPTPAMTLDQIKALMATRPPAGFDLKASDGSTIHLPPL